jgi:prolyl oligopeptidase
VPAVTQSRRLAGPGTKFLSTLITTGDHDDRVFPAHSYKFAAAMQNAQAGDPAVLIRVETRTGHGQAGQRRNRSSSPRISWRFFRRRLGWNERRAAARDAS